LEPAKQRQVTNLPPASIWQLLAPPDRMVAARLQLADLEQVTNVLPPFVR